MVPVLRETSILNVLKGAANIVQVEDSFLMRPAKGAAEVWSVLEHFPHNLYKVRHRFRSEEAAKCVVFQVLLGLLSLHSADIVHRDCKPDNVLVDLGPAPPRTVRVALCDFNTSRSVHGFAPEARVPTVVPFGRQVTDRVTTSWWRAPEMWGWADTRQMTKKDLKSLDIFALGLVWANLLAVKSVLEYWEGVDPPKYRLLEILQKVDRPTDSDLNELGFSDDVSCFIRCVLSGNLEALRPEMTSALWPKNQENREAFLDVPYMGIREWVRQNAWQCKEDAPTLDLIASMTRFSYRERPTVESVVMNPFFNELRAATPPKAWAHRDAPQFDDVREVLREEHKRQGLAAQRAKELRELCGKKTGTAGEGSAGAQDAFFQRLAASAAADVEDSVRNVCDRVRSTLVESRRRRPRTIRNRPGSFQASR
jgi:serine/threonine protein kinase